MLIGNKEFDIENKSYIMGILNVTPDSFSDGGSFNNINKALKQVEKMIEEGADIIDIGGESTRPGYTLISDEDEIDRIVPIIKEIKKQFNISISVDTYKSTVARQALEVGADMINDIWGLKYDPLMADIISKYQTSYCLMHNRYNNNYQNIIEDICIDINESLRIATEAGINKDKIILDPGIGFAKTLEQNLIVINQLEELNRFQLPLLLGVSRKSVIGLTLDLPIDNRLEGTIALNVMGLMKGIKFFRVHDIKANYRAIRMSESVLNQKKV